ncbi:MAG TPA: LuxR C-terminal-related transcriptional regulator [Streptosporangiaceae bacterium]|nr:LuxR C-terminal-related transcriptional regulator [Streptosporangiaceae bacterium]
MPVPTEVALGNLVSAQLDNALDQLGELRRLHLTLEALAQAPVVHGDASGIQTQLLVGGDEVAEAMGHAARAARHEILSIYPGAPPPVAVLDGHMASFGRALACGVALRVLHTEAMQHVAHGIAYLRRLQEEGAQTRVTPVLPFQLFLVDGAVAHLAAEPADGRVVTLAVKGQQVGAIVRAVFEYCWTVGADPVSGFDPAAAHVTLSKRESAILRMFANGLKDETVARLLGISSRTLRRMSSEIMEKLGAESRFQAGVKAVQFGLLKDPENDGGCPNATVVGETASYAW